MDGTCSKSKLCTDKSTSNSVSQQAYEEVMRNNLQIVLLFFFSLVFSADGFVSLSAVIFQLFQVFFSLSCGKQYVPSELFDHYFDDTPKHYLDSKPVQLAFQLKIIYSEQRPGMIFVSYSFLKISLPKTDLPICSKLYQNSGQRLNG